MRKQRSTKEQILKAKELAIQGQDAEQIVKLTGVSLMSAKALVKSFKFQSKYPEPPVTTRQMNAEEIAKYGPPRNVRTDNPANQPKPAEKTKPNAADSELKTNRQIEMTLGPLDTGIAAREVEYVARSLKYLHINEIEIIIRTVQR